MYGLGFALILIFGGSIWLSKQHTKRPHSRNSNLMSAGWKRKMLKEQARQDGRHGVTLR